MPTAQEFLELLIEQSGDAYVLKVDVTKQKNPSVFDCSELVRWACHQLEVYPCMPDISWVQAMHCKAHKTLIDVAEGIATPGALLFRFSSQPSLDNWPKKAHVAVSQGNGRTIEALNKKHGVGDFKARGRRWTHAGLVPGLNYGT